MALHRACHPPILVEGVVFFRGTTCLLFVFYVINPEYWVTHVFFFIFALNIELFLQPKTIKCDKLIP